MILWYFKYLPFSILYLKSDIVKNFLQYIIRYRRSVVDSNLDRCFPKLSSHEKRKIISNIYKNISDILLEGLKGLSMSKEEILNRYPYKNKRIIDEYLNKGKSVIVAPCHFANWEWGVLAFGFNFPGKSIGIYKRINNPRIEKDMKARRALSGIQLFSTEETRMMIDEIPKGKLIVLMSDQNPSNAKEAIWVKFMGQDTACLHGMEKYAHRYELPVFFFDIHRTSRGNYLAEFILLEENILQRTKGEITQEYMTKLEQTVKQNPGDWLWTHKRWKHQKP
ncbi:MAG: lysophospholipid acyltransferase family protein [Bacteroidota bacterium]|nr:lysophospholipid acyltransferase family protein [Bacteroidota bacterium]